MQEQGFAAHGPVAVGQLVQMGHGECRLADGFEGLLGRGSGHTEALGVGHSAFLCEGGQRLIGSPLGFTQDVERRHDHVSRLTQTVHQTGIHIEILFSGVDEGLQALARFGAQVGPGGRRGGARKQLLAQVAQAGQPPIGLRFEEKGGVRHRFGAGRRELINQPGVHLARPGPAPDVRDALIVDGNDGHAIAGRSVAAGAGEIVVPALQPAKQVGRKVQCKSRHDHHEGNDRVGRLTAPATRQRGLHTGVAGQSPTSSC